MATRMDRREAYADKAAVELEQLCSAGVDMCGYAFSQVLLVKGNLAPGETGDALLAGADGDALRAALCALGYEPQDWCGLSALADGGAPLDAQRARLAIMTIDPAVVVACDAMAASVLREALADEIAQLPNLSEAMLEEGVVAHVLGMRVLNLGDFAASLDDPHLKQVMWARLKQVPPEGEPY